jgi:hypothetical protein
MTSDIGSLTAGLSGHGVRLGIEREGLREAWGNPPNCFLGALPFQRRISFEATNYSTLFLCLFPTITDTFA